MILYTIRKGEVFLILAGLIYFKSYFNSRNYSRKIHFINDRGIMKKNKIKHTQIKPAYQRMASLNQSHNKMTERRLDMKE